MSDPIELLRDHLDRPRYGKANGNGPLHLVTGTEGEPRALCGCKRFDISRTIGFNADSHGICPICQTRLNGSLRRARAAQRRTERAAKATARLAARLAAKPARHPVAKVSRKATALERVAAELDIPVDLLREAIRTQAPGGLRP